MSHQDTPSERNNRPFWQPQRHRDRRPALLARGRIKTALRRWFEAEGFIEVETACLQVSPGNETHLHAFRTEAVWPKGQTAPHYLHTSPEFACKKLLAAGERKIFTFAPVFRSGERGRLHHPEFCMLEWYRANEPYEQLMTDCQEILNIASNETGQTRLMFAGKSARSDKPAQRLDVSQAFLIQAGIDLMASCRADGPPDREALASAARAEGYRVADDDDWSDLFSRILVQSVEPVLGMGRPTILYDYPIHEAALARPCPHDARLAERFELYACGVELANGFGELTDADTQRARFEAAMMERRRRYGANSVYPLDEDFLAALQDMPPASGCALGFDRLVMLAVGAPHIEDVIWTPHP